jgi:PAS domain S-box-containing protein
MDADAPGSDDETRSRCRAAEARLRRLFDAAPDGIVVSRDGVILDANPAAARMLGFDAGAELLGVSLHALMSPVDTKTMIARIAAARDGSRLAPRAYEARRRDGTRVTAEITSVPYEYEGKPAVIGFARDVTERVRLEAQLARSERLAALGTLAAGVAHEINTPLTVTSLGIDALERRIERLLDHAEPGERRELATHLDDLRGGVARVAGIVRELRVFSRTDDDLPGPTDVVVALAGAERIAAHELRHRTRVSSEYGDVPLVIGHMQRLEQVFVNLLLNAAQAMPEGRAENQVHVRAYVAQGGRVAVEITDNGSGMTPDVLDRVFDPFFTTKPVGEGSGLGLAISHGIVTRLGGEIVLESQPGAGTTARVLFPPSSAVATPRVIEREPARSRAVPRRARVLVIDDEVALTAALRALLGDDHDVTTVNGGEAACALLLHGPSFDVVLCDVMMPVVTGMDVHARVAAAGPDVVPRLVFMTGGASTSRADAFLSSIPNRILAKPFVLADVERVLFDRASSGDARGRAESG